MNEVEALWYWLKSCRVCEKPHEWQWTCTHPDHPKHRHSSCGGGTWADPEDGHAYNRRLSQVDGLQQEYETVKVHV